MRVLLNLNSIRTILEHYLRRLLHVDLFHQFRFMTITETFRLMLLFLRPVSISARVTETLKFECCYIHRVRESRLILVSEITV